jgi:hypothetical protein
LIELHHNNIRHTHQIENRVLRGIFGAKREEVEGGWRRLHNEELRNLYASPNIIRVNNARSMKWAGEVSGMGEMKKVFFFFTRS